VLRTEVKIKIRIHSGKKPYREYFFSVLLPESSVLSFVPIV
jgi:hypothetical protein